jgi:hypothetical protein
MPARLRFSTLCVLLYFNDSDPPAATVEAYGIVPGSTASTPHSGPMKTAAEQVHYTLGLREESELR